MSDVVFSCLRGYLIVRLARLQFFLVVCSCYCQNINYNTKTEHLQGWLAAGQLVIFWYFLSYLLIIIISTNVSHCLGVFSFCSSIFLFQYKYLYTLCRPVFYMRIVEKLVYGAIDSFLWASLLRRRGSQCVSRL